MPSPQFMGGNVSIFNERISLAQFRNVDPISIIGLYLSESLLFFGILLILLNDFGLLSPGTHFGENNWVTFMVFFIGLCINFISIPFLYISSFKNFTKECDFWDKETFWILPLFFFGTYFLYNSLIGSAIAMLVLSVLFIVSVHIIFILKSRRIKLRESRNQLSDHGQYVMTMKYLSAYYVVSLFLLLLINPLSHFFLWLSRLI